MQIYIIKRKQTDQSQIIFTKANTVKKKKKVRSHCMSFLSEKGCLSKISI